LSIPSDERKILAKLDRVEYLLEILIVLKALEMNLSTHGVRRILKIRRERVSVISRLHKNSLKLPKAKK